MLHFSFAGRGMLRSLLPVSDGTQNAQLAWVGIPLNLSSIVRLMLPAVLVWHDERWSGSEL
jgi:hypothetical protein